MKKAELFLPWILLAVVSGIAIWQLIPVASAFEDEPLAHQGVIKLETVQAYSPFKPQRKVAVIEPVAKESIVATAETDVRALDEQPQPLDKEALASFVASVTVDDPRAPPIGKSIPYEGPAQAVLADPQLYSEFEANKRRSALKQFVVAAQNKVSKLERMIEKGKQRGISEQQLQEGLRKLAALKRGVVAVEQDLAY